MSCLYLLEPSRTNGVRDLRHGTPPFVPDKVRTPIPPWEPDIRRRRGAKVEFPQRRRQGAVYRSQAQYPGKSLAGTSRVHAL